MHCVALPLMAACITSPCPSRLHALPPLHHLAPCGCTHHIAMLHLPAYHLYISFFLFSANSPFAVQLLCSHYHPCRWTSGCPPPQEPTTVQPPTTTTMARWRW